MAEHNAAPRQEFTVGPGALIAACEEQQARQEKAAQAAQERASRYWPRPIDMGLLPHRIPTYVDALLARSAWDQGVPEERDRDQRPLHFRTYLVAVRLVVRGWTAEDFLEEMPGYTPGHYPHQNILWWELCHRRGRRRDPTPMVIEVFNEAEKKVSGGYLPDVDQAAYLKALTVRWRRWVDGGTVRLTKGERAVLGWVMDQMLAKGWLDVACPSRAVAKATGLTQRGACKILRRLDDRGILVCRRRGVADKRIRRASIYCLSPQLEQTFAPAHSKPEVPGGPWRAPERDCPGTTKRPERSTSHWGTLTVRPEKPQVKATFREIRGEPEFSYQRTTSSPDSCTSRGMLIGELTPPPDRGLFPPGGRARDGSRPVMTPELVAAIIRNLPEDSFRRGKPPPRPGAWEDDSALGVPGPLTAQQTAILRVQSGVYLKEWRGR
jgi:hypothetical protein